jgi:hypothetical protein
MGLIINGEQLIGRKMRVLLCGVERGMAQHFLNRAQIGALVQEMGGK